MDQREIDAITEDLKRLKENLKRVPVVRDSEVPADTGDPDAPAKPPRHPKRPTHK